MADPSKTQPHVRGPKKTPVPRRGLGLVPDPAKPKPAAPAAKAAKPEKAAAATPCGCGCGGTVTKKGSRFMPGHDAKLRGKIIRLQKAERAAKDPGAKGTAEEKAAALKAARADFNGVDIDGALKWYAVAHAK